MSEKKRRLYRSELEITALGVGCWRLSDGEGRESPVGRRFSREVTEQIVAH